MILNSFAYLLACNFLCNEFGVRGLFYAGSLSMLFRGILSLWVSDVKPGFIMLTFVSKEFIGLFSLGLGANLLINKLM